MAIDLGKIAQTLEGEYVSSKIYDKLDTVRGEDASYISRIDNNDQPLSNSTVWQITALDGVDGVDGTNAQSFNFKNNIANYAALPTTGNVINDAYYNLEDNLLYVYNGTSFPTEGNGIKLQGSTQIENWAAQNYVEKSLVIYANSIWRVTNGQTASSTDIPGESDKWISVGNKVDVVNEIDSVNSSDAVTGKAVSDLMIGDSVEVNDVALSYAVGQYVTTAGDVNPNGDTNFLTIPLESGNVVEYSMSMVQGTNPMIFKAEDGQVINDIQPTQPNISIRTGVFNAPKKGTLYINVRTTQAVVVNYLRLVKGLNIYDEFKSVTAVKYNFRDSSELVRVEGSFMAPNGVLIPNAQTLHKKINVKAGEVVNFGIIGISGTRVWVLVNDDGSMSSGGSSNNNLFALSLIISKNGTLYLNQNIGFEDVPSFEINSKVEEFKESVKGYIDSKNSMLVDDVSAINEPYIELIPNTIFKMASSTIGVTNYTAYGGASGYSVSQMIRVKAGDKILVSGFFGADNGVALFDNNGILSKKLLLGSNMQYNGVELNIESDGFVSASSLNNATKGFKLYNKSAKPNSASGGVTVYYDRTLRPWAFGLKESNTEAENTTILNNLIFKANQEDRSIELPEGIYKASNINFKPCHIYGKDRNTVLQTQTANKMFIMPDFDGLKNLESPFYSGVPGRGNFPGFSISGFCIDGKNIGTVGMDFGIHAFAKYERLVISNFTQYAMNTKGMLICDFDDIQLNACANGIKTVEASTHKTNLVTFHRLNIGGCAGIGVDWQGGSLIRFTALDTENCGTTNDLNTGVLVYRGGSMEGFSQGVIIESSWAEIVKGGFYAKLQGGAMHSIKNSNIKRDGDAQRAIINDGGTLIMENIYTAGGASGVFDVYTLGGGQTMQQGKFTGFHSEATGGVFKTAQYL